MFTYLLLCASGQIVLNVSAVQLPEACGRLYKGEERYALHCYTKIDHYYSIFAGFQHASLDIIG